MKRTYYWLGFLFFCFFLTIFSRACHADTFGLHLGSKHFPDKDFNNFNPGAYYRWDSGWTVGGYYNSERRASFYGGKQWDWQLASGIQANLMAGAVTGYGGIKPLIVPSLTFGTGGGSMPKFRLTYLPRVEKGGAAVVHVAVEWELR